MLSWKTLINRLKLQDKPPVIVAKFVTVGYCADCDTLVSIARNGVCSICTRNAVSVQEEHIRPQYKYNRSFTIVE